MSDIPRPDSVPLVSIVLPTYNRAHVLPLAIRSVLDQTFRDFELIIVNDNASDDTEGVVKSFSDPRIRYYRNAPNLKLPRSLNRGFSLARGKYLTWTSDDNMFAPNAIGTMVDELKKGEADFMFADYQEFSETDPGGHPIGGRAVKLPETPDMAAGNSIGACFMYTRMVYETIGDYDPDLFLNEDFDYWMRISRRFRLKHIPQALYYFRRNEESLYCSRFPEVRAGSLLVRHKNDYLNDSQVLEGLIDLACNAPEQLNSELLSSTYRFLKKRSYRLTCMFESLLRHHLHYKLRRLSGTPLADFKKGKSSFNDTRTLLSQLVGSVARVEYKG